MTPKEARNQSGAARPEGAEPAESDEALMARVREGHRPSLGFLLEQYWLPLVAYAAGIVDDRDVAQDVVQRTFIQVWKNRADWVPTSTVKAYLYRITRNLALNARRDRRLRQERQEEGGEVHVTPPRTPEETLEESRLRREVEEALSCLSDRRREVFILSRFYGLTHREIAQTLGTSPQTVSNQMSAALEKLRKALSHHFEDG